MNFPHTHTYSSVSHVLALSHVWSKQDGKQTRERNKSYIHHSDCVPLLLWHIESTVFLLFGALFCFVMFGFFFWTFWFLLGLQARTRKDWGIRQGETNILRHTLYTQHKADWFLKHIFLFSPSSTEPKSCTLCCGVDWGELDGSIYIHLSSDTYY